MGDSVIAKRLESKLQCTLSTSNTSMTTEEDQAISLLENLYARYTLTLEYGSKDPTISDADRLNWLRKAILEQKNRIRKYFPRLLHTSAMKRPDPPVVCDVVVAYPEQVRQTANKAIAAYHKDLSYQYVLANYYRVPPHLDYIKRIVTRLSLWEEMVKRDDLLQMRARIGYCEADKIAMKKLADRLRVALGDL